MGGTKAGAAKRRQTIIDNQFAGDEQAYIDWQRANASRGGKIGGAKSPTNFKHLKPSEHKLISSKGGKATVKANKDMPAARRGVEQESSGA